MKHILVIAGCIFILKVFSPGTSPMLSSASVGKLKERTGGEWKDKYCASLKEGNIIVMNGKAELVVNVTLENGSKITTDGYVIKKDGTKTALKNGDCVDKAGTIIQSKKSKESNSEKK